MQIPVYIGGEESGTMEIVRRGAYTLFTARCAARAGLIRLAVFGGGQSGYLGVMQPEGGELVLRRRLSRAQMRDFPPGFEYAAELGAAPPTPAGKDGEARPAAHAARREEENGWTRRTDGSLVCRSGERLLLALPCSLRRAVPGADLRRIDGGSYMVFRY